MSALLNMCFCSTTVTEILKWVGQRSTISTSCRQDRRRPPRYAPAPVRRTLRPSSSPYTPYACMAGGAQRALLPVAVGAMNIHDVCDRRTSSDVRQHHCLMPLHRGGGIKIEQWVKVCFTFKQRVRSVGRAAAMFTVVKAPLSKLDTKWNKKLSWCWQTRVTRLEVSQGHQTWYNLIC